MQQIRRTVGEATVPPLALLKSSGQIVGERGGTAFPFRFWRGNAVPLAYTTAVGGRGGT